MFTAKGVGVLKAPVGFDVTVDYFDDRVSPLRLVNRSTYHSVTSLSQLTLLVSQQLQQLASADQLQMFDQAVTAQVLGTI